MVKVDEYWYKTHNKGSIVASKISKTFCIVPWVHMALNTKGEYRLCCNQSWLKKDIDDGGYLTPYNSFEVPFEDIWNSETYKETRIKMLNGIENPPCRKCYREEATGMYSTRQSLNNSYLYSFPLELLDPSGYCPTNTIKYVDIRLGNKCNLKCRMCNPQSSNQWIGIDKETRLRGVPEKELDYLNSMDWFNKQTFWENLFSVVKDCELMYFSGGEPTLFKDDQTVLFQKCIDAGVSKNIILRYNTNMTTSLEKFSKYWDEFKEVRVSCSIDAVGKLNDYIRYPSKWEIVEKNFLEVYKKAQEEGSNIKMKAMPTIQILNIFGLVDLLEYLRQLNLVPFINMLNQPAHYNIRVLNNKQKRKLADEITDWYQTNLDWLQQIDLETRSHFSPKISGVVNYLLSEDWSHLYARFMKETKKLDKLFGKNVEDYIPELVRREDD